VEKESFSEVKTKKTKTSLRKEKKNRMRPDQLGSPSKKGNKNESWLPGFPLPAKNFVQKRK